jgi:Tol biopolymer transport system component
MQAAAAKETIQGDLRGAVALYEQALAQAEAEGNRLLISTALLALGELHLKLGESRSTVYFERIVREFSDQAGAVALAKSRLARIPDRMKAAPRTGLICADCVGPYIKDFTLSPDGRSLGYTNDKNDLMVRDLMTGHVTRLVGHPEESYATGRFRARRATWSPDSRQMAYFFRDGNAPGSVSDRSQLRVVATQPGSQPRTLVDNPEFVYVFPTGWSPDGTSILVSIQRRDLTWQIAWVSASSGAITVLKSLNWQFNEFGNGPALSPNGRHIVYAAFAVHRTSALQTSAAALRKIHILAVDGSEPETTLADTTSDSPFPEWTPDGGGIVFVSDRNSGSGDLLSVPIRNGRPTGVSSVVQSGIGRPALAGITRSEVLYYVLRNSEYSRILVADVQADNASTILRSLTGASPAWSPDGKRLAFLANGGVVVHSLETGGERTYAANHGGISGNPAWFHDGSALLLKGAQEGQTVIFRVDLETSEVRRIPVHAPKDQPADLRSGFFRAQGGLALSPDNSTAYFGTGASGVRRDRVDRVVAVGLATGQARQVTAVPGGASVSAVTADPTGRVLAITFSRDSEPTNSSAAPGLSSTAFVATVNVDGSNYRELHGPAPGRPVPGSERTGPGNVVPGPIALVPRISEPRWTPDGRALLFGIHEDDGTWRLTRVSAESGNAEAVGAVTSDEITRNGSRTDGFSISPDGRRIAYGGRATSRPTNELWALDLSSLLKKPQ